MPDYELRVLPLETEPSPQAVGWLQMVRRGFHETPATAATIQQWWADQLTDRTRLLGVYSDQRLPHALSPDHPVGTIGSLTRTINTGAGHLEPACFVTDVTVRATHRRRGLLRTMMGNVLTRAIQDGLAFATLTASEGGIYRRFGFGVAIDAISVEIDASGRNPLPRQEWGSVELADPADLEELRRDLFADFHGRQLGSHDRLAYYDAHLSGRFDYSEPPIAGQLRSAVHYDANAHPNGVVTWLDRGWGKPLDVIELIAETPYVQLGLWELLISTDGIDQVNCGNFDPSSRLPAAFMDARAVKQVSRSDHIWLRILDVAKALSLRPYAADVDLVLGVRDALGLCGVTWRLTAGQGSVQVVPTDARADVELDVDVLGSVYFGGHTLRDYAAGVDGRARFIEQLDAALRTPAPPWCTTSF